MSRSLAARQQDLAREVILDAAIQRLVQAPHEELSVRAVAKQSNVSERTIFRYFASREDLLDAIAREYTRRLNAPRDPSTVAELIAYVPEIFARFEDNAPLTRAALRSEIYHRVRTRDASSRGSAINRIIEEAAPERSSSEREIAATNIRYVLTASTWNYYRFNFELSPTRACECVLTVVRNSLDGLGIDRGPDI